jgi:hypothetical protein
MTTHTPIQQLEQLTITNASRNFLDEIAKWAKFLSILGFVLIGVLLVFAFFATPIFEIAMEKQTGTPNSLGFTMLITNLGLAIIYFFPVYYLLQFSNKMKKALVDKNEDTLAKAFEMLKSHYKFIGVFTIITLSLYALFAIVAVMGLL